jgi:predicted nuclease of predicted toxin-antitoxin system
MRFLANENVPRAVVDAVRARGHDTIWMRTDGPGATDNEVLERAGIEGRVLLTFDKDFGELVRKRGLSASHGVVLFRLTLERPAELAERVVAALASRDDWPGHFSVVEPKRIRMRPLAR